MILAGVATFLVAYFIGAINPATVIARVRGVDLRGAGSGNPGATNAGRVLGRRTGVLVGAMDIAKGFVPAFIAGLWLGTNFGLIAGFAAILGHVTSPFLGFRGGKGVATAAGAILGTNPLWLVPMLTAFAIAFALTRRVGIASVTAAVVMVPSALLLDDTWQEVAFATAVAVLIVARHQLNLRAAIADLFGSPDHADGSGGQDQVGPSSTTSG